MRAQRSTLPVPSALLVLLLSAGSTVAQTGTGSLPATAPTQGTPLNTTAPLAATANGTGRADASGHPAQVSCADGQLTVRAQNSSLNGILRAIARCTGMRITGRVADQRVFGNYGPAAPATVLATLLDGTGSNMLLQEAAADRPAELILTPRLGGPTPPSQMATSAAEDEDDGAQPQTPFRPAGGSLPMRPGMPPQMQSAGMGQGNQQQGNQQQGNQQQGNQQTGSNSAVTGPQPIPQPFNNVNGSPNNRSPTASTYPTTNSVPLDTVATPSTTPPADGIVDAPNPPPAGSDTAAALNGAPAGTPGTTNINPAATSQTSTPGGTNTTVPATNTDGTSPTQQPATLTPEQIFQQLQQRQQQQQQQQQQQTSPQ